MGYFIFYHTKLPANINLCVMYLRTIFLLSKFLTDIPGYNVDANGHDSVALALDNYLKSMVSIYSEMGVLKVAKQNQQDAR